MILEVKSKAKYNLQPIQQRVAVSFNYPVHFTNGIFDLDNPLLAQVITNDGEAKPNPGLNWDEGIGVQNGPEAWEPAHID